jgi:DNA repair exonuclease SbcCD ATPase subunit
MPVWWNRLTGKTHKNENLRKEQEKVWMNQAKQQGNIQIKRGEAIDKLPKLKELILQKKALQNTKKSNRSNIIKRINSESVSIMTQINNLEKSIKDLKKQKLNLNTERASIQRNSVQNTSKIDNQIENLKRQIAILSPTYVENNKNYQAYLRNPGQYRQGDQPDPPDYKFSTSYSNDDILKLIEDYTTGGGKRKYRKTLKKYK